MSVRDRFARPLVLSLVASCVLATGCDGRDDDPPPATTPVNVPVVGEDDGTASPPAEETAEPDTSRGGSDEGSASPVEEEDGEGNVPPVGDEGEEVSAPSTAEEDEVASVPPAGDEGEEVSAPSTAEEDEVASVPPAEDEGEEVSAASTAEEGEVASVPSVENEGEEESAPSTEEESEEVSVPPAEDEGEEVSAPPTAEGGEEGSAPPVGEEGGSAPPDEADMPDAPETTPPVSGSTVLDGSWLLACSPYDEESPDDDHVVLELTIAGGNTTLRETLYRDEGCTIPAPEPVEIALFGSIVYPGGTTETPLGTALHIDVTVTRLEVDGVEPGPGELAALTSLGIFDAEHDIALATDGELHVGDHDADEGLDGRAPDRRPTALDPVPFTRQ